MNPSDKKKSGRSTRRKDWRDRGWRDTPRPLHSRFCMESTADVLLLRTAALEAALQDPEALNRPFSLLVHCYGLAAGTSERLPPLHHAAALGHAACVASLLEAGSNPQLLSPRGFNAIYYAVCSPPNGANITETVKELLSKNVPPCAVSPKRSWHPSDLLDFCVHRRNSELVELLLDSGVPLTHSAEGNSNSVCKSLIRALALNEVDVLKMLLLHGADLTRNLHRVDIEPQEIPFIFYVHFKDPKLLFRALAVYRQFGGDLLAKNMSRKNVVEFIQECQNPMYRLMVPWLRNLAGQPLSLQGLCRNRLRNHLDYRYWQTIGLLPLPRSIQAYLRYPAHDELPSDVAQSFIL